jgi:hypothetical protein
LPSPPGPGRLPRVAITDKSDEELEAQVRQLMPDYWKKYKAGA